MKRLVHKSLFLLIISLNACTPIVSSNPHSANSTFAPPISNFSVKPTNPLDEASLNQLKAFSQNNHKKKPFSFLTEDKKQKTKELLTDYFVQNIDFTQAQTVLGAYLNTIKNDEEKKDIFQHISFLKTFDEKKFKESVNKEINNNLENFKTALENYEYLENDIKQINKLLYYLSFKNKVTTLETYNILKKNKLEQAQYLKLDSSIVSPLKNGADAEQIKINYFGKKESIAKVINDKIAYKLMLEVFEKALVLPNLAALLKSNPHMMEEELNKLEIDRIPLGKNYLEKIKEKIKKQRAQRGEEFLEKHVISLKLIDHENNKVDTVELIEKFIDKNYTEEELNKFQIIINFPSFIGIILEGEYFETNKIFTILKNLKDPKAYVSVTEKEQFDFRDELGKKFAFFSNKNAELVKILKSIIDIEIINNNIIYYKSKKIGALNNFAKSLISYLLNTYSDLAIEEIRKKALLIAEEIKTKNSFAAMRHEAQEIIKDFMED